MSSEYFSNQNWVQTMSGIYPCLFHQKKNDSIRPLSVHLDFGIVEVVFCIRGNIVFHRTTGQIDWLDSQSILLLSSCDGLIAAKIEQPLECICLRIDESAAKDSLSSLCRTYGDLPITMSQIGQMMAQWDGICLIPPQMWSQSTFHSLLCLTPENRGQYCIMKVFELLYLLYVGHTQTGIRPKTQNTDLSMHTALAIQAYLMEHLSEKLTINDLSRQFHLSATACKSCFHACCKQPIHQWISEKRMEKTAQLPMHTTMSVVEIAQAVGYSGCSQFNAAFKKKFGKTPRQYRNSVRSR